MEIMTHCDSCGKFCKTGDMVEIDDEFFCQDCITYCDACGEPQLKDSFEGMFEVVKNGVKMRVCYSCYGEYAQITRIKHACEE